MVNKTWDMINKILYVVRKIIKITVCIVLVIILTPIFLYYSYFSLQIAFASHSPLRQSEARIQAWLLREVPIGSSRADVRVFFNEIRHEWWRRDEENYRNQDFMVSENSVSMHLGRHIALRPMLFIIPIAIEERVSATWRFDESGRLIAVEVRKGVK